MFEKRRIRSQMYFGVAIMMAIVVVLSASSFHGSLQFRNLIKSARGRAYEMPLVAELSVKISQLRATIGDISASTPCEVYQSATDKLPIHELPPGALTTIRTDLLPVRNAFENYRYQLENSDTNNPLGNNTRELNFVKHFDEAISKIEQVADGTQGNWIWDGPQSLEELKRSVDELQIKTSHLPKFLNQRLDDFSKSARAQYHVWMYLTGLFTLGAVMLMAIVIRSFNRRIFQPLEVLVNGSRIVARGRYNHRIELETRDEMAELAGALNAMTKNFQQIKSDLNQKVRERTKEVVRSEKMASVGFLAAGVAHEINNPLASIAWSAESLESRIQEILDPSESRSQIETASQIDDMKKYLRRIQDEAFRCKGITSALLDFSRMGDTKKQSTNLAEIVQTVIDMVRPLSRYRGRHIEFKSDPTINALVNSQELKQVALNLITNSLDSVSEGGHVKIRLEKDSDNAVLVVSDDGCGMDDEVLQHLFEPFFTRRRDGQGTGLGLSISYQIIQEHGGQIIPRSAGPGMGSSFTVKIPLVQTVQNEEKSSQRRNVA
ncbi:MAG: HAMP domain-containing sensor histidine kinase [Planctomycetota bacterium]